MSFVLNDEWAVRCDSCGGETASKYASLKLANLCVVAWGWGDESDDDGEVKPDAKHLCPTCRKAGATA